MLGAGPHGVDDYRIVSVEAEHADLQQLAVARRPDTHREVVIEMPLGDGVADGVEHVFVSDVVLSSGLRDAHGMTRYLVRLALSRNLVSSIRIGISPETPTEGSRCPSIRNGL
jgi:hypothetical protein